MYREINNFKLNDTLAELLVVDKYKDYCPNGMQIEGKSKINKIVTGVSISLELIDAAINLQADAIIVHHGIFWNKLSQTILSYKKKQIAKILAHDINLYAYHLPLDNHPWLGNNYRFGKWLGLDNIEQNNKHDCIWYGETGKQILTYNDIIKKFNFIHGLSYREICNDLSIASRLINDKEKYKSHQILSFGDFNHDPIKRVAWCTGGGDSLFVDVINKRIADLFITGEHSEPIVHLARDSGIRFIAAGHYFTEIFGIIALSDYLSNKLDLDVEFIDLYSCI